MALGVEVPWPGMEPRLNLPEMGSDLEEMLLRMAMMAQIGAFVGAGENLSDHQP